MHPYYNLSVGQFIKQELKRRKWNAKYLSDISGLSLKCIRRILNDKEKINVHLADTLGNVLNVPARYLLILDSNYRVSKEQ